MNNILITGAAGFIGFHIGKFFLDKKCHVTGIDAVTDYYDINLKKNRIKQLKKYKLFKFHKIYLEDAGKLKKIIDSQKFDIVIHLAAQAGVRYSIENPSSYINSNIIGTFNLLDGLKKAKIKHLLIASTSSVYGANHKLPFNELDKADKQISIYASTKKSTEALSHSYSHTFNMPITMMRFFTVYGPWGRPDMALFRFTKNILLNKSIEVYNYGKMMRDFTYIDDIAKSIYLLSKKVPKVLKSSSKNKFNDFNSVAPFRIVNIGNSQKVKLMDFISAVEEEIGKKAKMKMKKMQTGDVASTLSDTRYLFSLTGFRPMTNYKSGIKKFIQWYKEYYKY